MDPITTAVIISLLIVYIIVVYIVIRKLLSRASIHWIVLILLHIYALLIAVVLPISLLYENIYHSHIYPFIDWLIYTYGR